jgi:hypothetical protein
MAIDTHNLEKIAEDNRTQYYGEEFLDRTKHLTKGPSGLLVRRGDVAATKLMLDKRAARAKGLYIHPDNPNNQVRTSHYRVHAPQC